MSVRAACTFMSLHQRSSGDNDLAVILYNMSQCCPLWRFIWSPSHRRSQSLCRSVTFSRQPFLPLIYWVPLRCCRQLLLSKATLKEVQDFPNYSFQRISLGSTFCSFAHPVPERQFSQSLYAFYSKPNSRK